MADCKFAFLPALFIVCFMFLFCTGEMPVSTDEDIQTDVVEIESGLTDTPENLETVDKTALLYYDVPLSEDFQEYIFSLCKDNNVPPAIILAMINKESSFDPSVVSKTNDYGLMQINKINHKWLSEKYGIDDFLDPYQNVYCGIMMLGEYIDTYEDIEKALMCYNLGENKAKKMWKSGRTSTKYSRSIVSLAGEYEEALMKGGEINE